MARVLLDGGADPNLGVEHIPLPLHRLTWTPLYEAAY